MREALIENLLRYEDERKKIILCYESMIFGTVRNCIIPDSVYIEHSSIRIISGSNEYQIVLNAEMQYDEDEENYKLKYSNNVNIYIMFL